jgi:hypothetical protein
MASIYANSFLSIAATRACNSSEGFLGPRKTKSGELVSFHDDHGSFQLSFCSLEMNFSPGSVHSGFVDPLMVCWLQAQTIHAGPS